MPSIFLPDLRLNAHLTGPEAAPALVLLHPLGLHAGIWEAMMPHLARHRVLRLDMRGHGGSDMPPAPYSMGSLIRDVERAMEHFALKDAVVLGVSIGGLIAQGLAVKRFDLVRALILSNTAARLGHESQWQKRIDLVREKGLPALHDATMERWLGRNWRAHPALPPLSAAFLTTREDGWIGCANAIARSDFYETTATLRLPTLFIAGGNDGSTPPDLMRETADLIPGHHFRLMRGIGHVPPVEAPEAYAEIVKDFLRAIGDG